MDGPGRAKKQKIFESVFLYFIKWKHACMNWVIFVVVFEGRVGTEELQNAHKILSSAGSRKCLLFFSLLLPAQIKRTAISRQ